jgi:hypothetical protein
MARSPLEILSDQLAELEARDPASLHSRGQTDLEALRGLFEPAPTPTHYGNAHRTLEDFDKPGETWGNA